MNWKGNYKTHIFIFNVGRGLSIFIRTPFNHGIKYDYGSSEDFSPNRFLKEKVIPHLDSYKKHSLAQNVVSHPHLDHISEIEFLKEDKSLNAALLTCPHDKDGEFDEKLDWSRIKNPEGSDKKIEIYKSLYEKRTLPLQTIQYESTWSVPNVEYGIYYARPPIVNKIHPESDQDYGNGVSLVFYYRHGNDSILVPGDITPDVLKHILRDCEGTEKRYSFLDHSKAEEHPSWYCKSSDQPSLKALLNSGLTVLVAPHHGLESCFSEDLYDSIGGGKPKLVVIADKKKTSNVDGKIDKRYLGSEGAEGLLVTEEGSEKKKYSISTEEGYHALIAFQGTGGIPKVYIDRDTNKLLSFI